MLDFVDTFNQLNGAILEEKKVSQLGANKKVPKEEKLMHHTCPDDKMIDKSWTIPELNMHPALKLFQKLKEDQKVGWASMDFWVKQWHMLGYGGSGMEEPRKKKERKGTGKGKGQ